MILLKHYPYQTGQQCKIYSGNYVLRQGVGGSFVQEHTTTQFLSIHIDVAFLCFPWSIFNLIWTGIGSKRRSDKEN